MQACWVYQPVGSRARAATCTCLGVRWISQVHKTNDVAVVNAAGWLWVYGTADSASEASGRLLSGDS
jgi:hypothetical protein